MYQYYNDKPSALDKLHYTFEKGGFQTNKWMPKTLTLASIGVSFPIDDPCLQPQKTKWRSQSIISYRKLLKKF